MSGPKIALLLLVLCGLLSSIDARALNPKKVILAINAGSHKTQKSTLGFAFQRDQGYDEETNAVDYGNDANLAELSIKYAKDQAIYMTERHGYNSFSYQLALENEGTYTLILKFCEMYFDKPGRRVFHVRLGDQRVVTNLDLFAKSGRFIAHDEYVEFRYVNGKILFKNQPCPAALVDGKLILTFEKTPADNPIIQGIVLYSGGIDQTDYEDLTSFKANWDKQYMAEQRKKAEQQSKIKDTQLKKKEKIIVRNDHQELEDDYEEVEAHNANNVPAAEQTRVSMKDLITSPIGALSLLGGFFVAFYVLTSVFFAESSHNEQKKSQ